MLYFGLPLSNRSLQKVVNSVLVINNSLIGLPVESISVKSIRKCIHLGLVVLGFILLISNVTANEELASPQLLIEVEYDINNLTIIIAQEQAVPLRSFSLTGYDNAEITLSDYAELQTYNFDRISGPVCIQFIRTDVSTPRAPRICESVNMFAKIPLAPRDVFWLTPVLEQLIAVRLNYENNEPVYCSVIINTGSCRANFQLPPPTPTPSATPTLTPSPTPTPIPPGADLLVTDGQLGSYFISPDPVTDLEFDNFRKSDAYDLPDHINPTQSIPILLDAPYLGATWEEAAAYCVWHSGYDRLPTVAEWQTALRLFPEQFNYRPELVEWTDTKTSSNSGQDWYNVVGIGTADEFYPSDSPSRFRFGFRCIKLIQGAN